MSARLLLASASPARLATLRSAGIEPAVAVSGVDEPALLADAGRRATAAGRGPVPATEQVLLLARAKAEDVRGGPAAEGADLVLGCDSMLEMAGPAGPMVVGKPADAAEARERWRAMRGGSGVLHTGHWLIRSDGEATGATSSTQVHFADLDEQEIDAYVATGEPLRVAGAFTIDGLGGPFVTGIEGDHHGVVGLSLPLFRELLGRLGVTIPDLWS
ncbi:Maf family protein [Georgenia alba]|uniref:Nucleoside triphosphate pyrophosphatase n=1 Tax=Georgenia alba TaxID=2233858 RepID=A0ABW2QC78_9MICO